MTFQGLLGTEFINFEGGLDTEFSSSVWPLLLSRAIAHKASFGVST